MIFMRLETLDNLIESMEFSIQVMQLYEAKTTRQDLKAKITRCNNQLLQLKVLRREAMKDKTE